MDDNGVSTVPLLGDDSDSVPFADESGDKTGDSAFGEHFIFSKPTAAGIFRCNIFCFLKLRSPS